MLILIKPINSDEKFPKLACLFEGMVIVNLKILEMALLQQST